MNQFFREFNANKWNKLHGDCAIRSLVLGLGIDYEAACKKLNVKCIPGEGYCGDNGNETSGIDLDLIQERFSAYLGDIQDNLLANPDITPLDAMMNAKPLSIWLADKDYLIPGKYLLFLDDNAENDGGHIVYADCRTNPCYYDTAECDDMPVQAWIKINKVIPKASALHYKYDKQSKRFY